MIPSGTRDRSAESTPPVERWVRSPVTALSFWSAVTLPALYVPLFASGLHNPETIALFFGLLAVHVVALYGGRRYGRRDG